MASLLEKQEELANAIHELIDAFCEAIGIKRLVEWMVKKLDKKVI